MRSWPASAKTASRALKAGLLEGCQVFEGLCCSLNLAVFGSDISVDLVDLSYELFEILLETVSLAFFSTKFFSWFVGFFEV